MSDASYKKELDAASVIDSIANLKAEQKNIRAYGELDDKTINIREFLLARDLPTSQIATEPCDLFSIENLRVNLFIRLILDQSVFSIEHRLEAIRNAEQYDFKAPQVGDPQANALLSQLVEQMTGTTKPLFSLNYYYPLLAELVLCRVADNYLVYLQQLLALIFRTRPETLKSGEQERLDYILQYTSMEDLISALAEKRVDKLSFYGMRDLAKYFDEKLGLPLFQISEQLEEAVQLIELRNIIVHNRGIVNNIFKKKLPNYAANVNERIGFRFEEVINNAIFVAKSVLDIDERAIAKFGLPYKSYKTTVDIKVEKTKED